MDIGDRCEAEFWDLRCERRQGHDFPHSAHRGRAPISWGNTPELEHRRDAHSNAIDDDTAAH